MEFSALFLSCVFHMLWRVMLDFSPTAGKPVSHLLCESWSYRGNGGNTEGFFIRAFDQDIVDFFLWRTINFHGNFPNPRSSQRWISQQDKSSSLSRNDRTLVETYLGHDHFHDGKHRYGFPRCHLTSLFWLGKLRRNAEELKGFWYLISMPSTTPGLCLAMSKWANELTSFPTKWRANEKHGTGWGWNITQLQYLCIDQPGNDHISHQRGKIIIFKRVFFCGGMGDRFLGGFLNISFSPFFWCIQFFGCSKQVLFLRYLPGLQRDFWAGAWGQKTVGVSIFPKGKIHIKGNGWVLIFQFITFLLGNYFFEFKSCL